MVNGGLVVAILALMVLIFVCLILRKLVFGIQEIVALLQEIKHKLSIVAAALPPDGEPPMSQFLHPADYHKLAARVRPVRLDGERLD